MRIKPNVKAGGREEADDDPQGPHRRQGWWDLQQPLRDDPEIEQTTFIDRSLTLAHARPGFFSWPVRDRSGRARVTWGVALRVG